MKISYVALTKVHITAAKFYIEKGDILTFSPLNKNTLTVFRAQTIVKTMPYTQALLNAMWNTGMIQPIPPAQVIKLGAAASLSPIVPPAPAAPVTPEPAALKDQAAKQESAIDTNDTESSEEEEESVSCSETDHDPDPSKEEPKHFLDGKSREELLAIAKSLGLDPNPQTGEKKLRKAILAAEPKA